MHCCICAGACMHIGPGSYCRMHGGSRMTQTFPNPYITPMPITLSPISRTCGACGSTAVNHTDEQCRANQNVMGLKRALVELPQRTDYQANRYDSDDKHTLHLWADGKSYDIAVPKEATDA